MSDDVARSYRLDLVSSSEFRNGTVGLQAVSRTGERVVVQFDPDDFQVTIRFRAEVVQPAWGSQASDDWLDWISSQRSGPSFPLPVDEPDWLRDEGYHL